MIVVILLTRGLVKRIICLVFFHNGYQYFKCHILVFLFLQIGIGFLTVNLIKKDSEKTETNSEIESSQSTSTEKLHASLNPSNPSLVDLICILETKELWNKFHELGTEMIITKSGR